MIIQRRGNDALSHKRGWGIANDSRQWANIAFAKHARVAGSIDSCSGEAIEVQVASTIMIEPAEGSLGPATAFQREMVAGGELILSR